MKEKIKLKQIKNLNYLLFIFGIFLFEILLYSHKNFISDKIHTAITFLLIFVYLFAILAFMVTLIISLFDSIRRIKYLNKIRIFLEIIIIVALWYYAKEYIINENIFCGRTSIFNVFLPNLFNSNELRIFLKDPRTYQSVLFNIINIFVKINVLFIVKFNHLLGYVLILIFYLLLREIFEPITSTILTFALISLSPIQYHINSDESVLMSIVFTLFTLYFFILKIKKYKIPKFNNKIKREKRKRLNLRYFLRHNIDYIDLLIISSFIIATLSRYELSVMFGLSIILALIIYHFIFADKKVEKLLPILIILEAFLVSPVIHLYLSVEDVNLKGVEGMKMDFFKAILYRVYKHIFIEQQLKSYATPLIYLISLIISVIWIIFVIWKLLKEKERYNEKQKMEEGDYKKKVYFFLFTQNSLYLIIYFVLMIGFHKLGLMNINNYMIHSYVISLILFPMILKAFVESLFKKSLHLIKSSSKKGSKKRKYKIKATSSSYKLVYIIYIIIISILILIQLKHPLFLPIFTKYPGLGCNPEILMIYKTYMKNQKELNQCYVIRYNHRYPILYYIIKNLNNKVITPTYPDFEMLNYTRINFIFTKELRSLFKENRGCYVYLFRKYPESLIKYDGAPNITLEQFKEILNRINCKIEEIMNVTQNPIYLIKFSCEK